MKINYLFFPLLLLCLLLNACSILESQLNTQSVEPVKQQNKEQEKEQEKEPAKTASKPPRTDNKALATKPQQKEKQPAKPASKTPPADSKSLVTKQNINRLLKEMDFLAALALIRQEVGQGMNEKELQEEYLAALNGAIAQGENALTGDDPEQAGRLFRATLDNFPKDTELCRDTGLTASLLDEKINHCADQLMEAGIISYRSGNLGKAIEEWKKIATFHPRHQASQKAIQTTNVQLVNLKQIETGQ